MIIRKHATIYTLLLAFCLAVTVSSGCKKSEERVTGPLTGTWKLNANYMSPGGPGVWTVVPGSDKSYMQFFASGIFKSNMFNGYQIYTFKETEFTIQSNDNVAFTFSYEIKHDTLIINQFKPAACIDGCGIRFIKQK